MVATTLGKLKMLINAPSVHRGKHTTNAYGRSDGHMTQCLMDYDNIPVSAASSAQIFTRITNVKNVHYSVSGSNTSAYPACSGTAWKVASSPGGKTSSGTYIDFGFSNSWTGCLSVTVIGEDER